MVGKIIRWFLIILVGLVLIGVAGRFVVPFFMDAHQTMRSVLSLNRAYRASFGYGAYDHFQTKGRRFYVIMVEKAAADGKMPIVLFEKRLALNELSPALARMEPNEIVVWQKNAITFHVTQYPITVDVAKLEANK